MKRLILAGLVLALVVCAGFAQEILYRDSATLLWDAVATDANGDPLLPEDVVTYEVYIYDSALTLNDQIISNLTYVGATAATQMVIVFPDRRNWYAGVRTKVVTGEPQTVYSAISWSYDVEVVGIDGPFVYQPHGSAAPARPENLRDLEM